MIRSSAPFALVVLAACGASHPSASASATSFPAEETTEGSDAGSAVSTPDGGDAPDFDLGHGNGAFDFVRALCDHVASADDVWLAQHLSPKIRGRIGSQRTKTSAMVVPLGTTAATFRASLSTDDGSGMAPCPLVPVGGSIGTSPPIESFVQGSTHRKGDAYTFVVDVAGPHPQVLELAWDLPKHPFPSTAKKAPFAIDGSVIDPSADAATNAALASLVLAVRTHPQCLWEEAARAPSSPVLAIEATKTEGTETTVRLYPTSDPVSASLLACLETELTDVAKAKIKAKRFAIEGVLHVYLDPKTMPTKSFSFSGTKQL